MNETYEYVSDATHRHLEDAWQLSRKLKENPELPYFENMASEEIATMLAAAGYDVEYPFFQKELGYGTAFKAVFKNGDGPNIAIMTEYDALPDVGHGCGHNLHGSMSVLTALALLELKEHFKGTVTVIGTPAEEENGAKIPMAEKGVFDEMALALMIHCWSGGMSQPDMDVLSLRCYEVEFFGAQSHAVAAPWCGRSALAAARKFLDLVDARRECFTPDIKVNSVILDGGRAPNIIPEYSKVRMEFRTDSRGGLEKVDEIIRKCAQGAAMALDCTVTLTPGLLDFADMVRIQPLEDEITRIFKHDNIPIEPVAPPIGSSDVGNVSYHCPTIQPLLSITESNYALHTAQLRDATCHPDARKALQQGAAAMAQLSLRVFNDEGFRNEVRSSFEQQRAAKLNTEK